MRFLGVLMNPELRTGAHRRYLELMDGLARSGHTVVVLCSPAAAECLSAASAIIVKYENRHRSRAFQFRHQAIYWVREYDNPAFDWVIVHGETHFLAGAYLSRRCDARLLFAYRSNTVEELRQRRRHVRLNLRDYIESYLKQLKIHWYEHMVAARAHSISFQSPVDRDEIARRIPWARSRMTIVPGNIGGPRFPEQIANSNSIQEMKRLLFVGGLGWRKGVDVLLSSFAIAVRSFPDLRLDIVGFGDQEENLRNLTHDLAIEHAVVFHGRIREPLEMIARSDLVVIPSLFDSFPDTVLEALHVGTPVIGAKVGGIPHQIGSDEYLFPPADPDALASLVIRFATDVQFYQDARKHAQEQADIFRFDWVQAWVKSLPD